MASTTLPRSAARSLPRAVPSVRSQASRVATRCLHQNASPITASPLRNRPGVRQWNQRVPMPAISVGRRTMFIQTESTPNPDALKFNPNQRVLPESISSPFLEYLTPRSTLAPPHPSPLAAKLLNIDGVTSVFFGVDYVTVTKDSATPWAHVKPEIFAIINEFMLSGQIIVNTVEDKAGESGQEGTEQDSLAYDENDSEVVGMIKELLETRVRPAIQEDGGDIEFRGFHDGQVLLKLRGACRTCDSSTVTLKNGIESMLMHYIEEVQGVQQVMDQEEEIAMKEFAKFEEKLRQQKGPDAAPSAVGKGSLDTVEG
ncbi:HIRA-interacting protein 5 [Zopfia rhizophila CBS 207.26]|uniref:HIRA-interacting protein 5 n=1 Tax=Zopfia rhizophila CBS 207.26 TaxID=1314779 RepID=A0A6A6EGL1_9PEZI|nr:HIRA-interacting protein 5 [Zopfia rhizophila CBS 207.26]